MLLVQAVVVLVAAVMVFMLELVAQDLLILVAVVAQVAAMESVDLAALAEAAL
jgi:hypothetical protein